MALYDSKRPWGDGACGGVGKMWWSGCFFFLFLIGFLEVFVGFLMVGNSVFSWFLDGVVEGLTFFFFFSGRGAF